MDSQPEKPIPPVMEQPHNTASPSHISPQPTITAHIDYAADAPRILLGQELGPEPTNMICRHCNEHIITTVELRVSMRTHLISGVCCGVGGCLCAWIPYFVDKAKTKDHYCPKCEQFLGSGKEWPFAR